MPTKHHKPVDGAWASGVTEVLVAPQHRPCVCKAQLVSVPPLPSYGGQLGVWVQGPARPSPPSSFLLPYGLQDSVSLEPGGFFLVLARYKHCLTLGKTSPSLHFLLHQARGVWCHRAVKWQRPQEPGMCYSAAECSPLSQESSASVAAALGVPCSLSNVLIPFLGPLPSAHLLVHQLL